MKSFLVLKPISGLRILICCSLLFILFLPTYKVMFSVWQRDDFTYCYIIPFIVLYLLFEKREELYKTISTPSWLGLLPFITGFLFYWLGELGGEFFSLYFSSWLIITGLFWLYMGWKKLKIIWFPLVFAIAMFPIPNFLYNKISVSLRLISSWLGVEIMQFYGMSAYREGNVIDLGFTQLQVVNACSGLRYLIPLIVLGVLLAYFYKAPYWKKIIIVISTVPLSIITNSFRIALTGCLYEYWGAVAAEGFFHGFSGWFIFMFSFLVLILEIWLLNLIPPKVSVLPVSSSRMDTKTKNRKLYQDIPRNDKSFYWKHQDVVVILFLTLTLILSQSIEFRERIPIKQSFDKFPLSIAKWTGMRQTIEQKFIDALDFSDYVIIDYQDHNNKMVNFYVAYYENQLKGESIHSPATCFPGGGWDLIQSGPIEIPLDGKNHSIRVNRALIQKGEDKQLSYFWFPQRGRILTNAYQLKAFAFWDALTRHRTDGSLVRLITPFYRLEDLDDCEERLQQFVRDVIPVLPTFLPE